MDILLTKRKYLKFQETYEKEVPLIERGINVQHHSEIVNGRVVRSILETPFYYERMSFEQWISSKLGFKGCIKKITIKV